MKLTSSGVPLCAITAIPNEPAWPPSPEPSSYAQSGVGGSSGCSCRAICVCVNAIDPPVATTIPLPGNGTGSRYFLRLPPAAAFADGGRTPHGRASAAPAPTPCRSKRLRVIPFMFASRVSIQLERGRIDVYFSRQDRFERADVQLNSDSSEP